MGVTIPKNLNLTGMSPAELTKLYSIYHAAAEAIKDSVKSAKALAKNQRYQELMRLCLRISTQLKKDEAPVARSVRQTGYHRRAA